MSHKLLLVRELAEVERMMENCNKGTIYNLRCCHDNQVVRRKVYISRTTYILKHICSNSVIGFTIRYV